VFIGLTYALIDLKDKIYFWRSLGLSGRSASFLLLSIFWQLKRQNSSMGPVQRRRNGLTEIRITA
jgi:hypothetical protein